MQEQTQVNTDIVLKLLMAEVAMAATGFNSYWWYSFT